MCCIYNFLAGRQGQSDCARPAKYRERLPEIKLILFSMISVLTGEALSRVPAYE